MCPPFSPPGFFDLTAPHTPSYVWMWGVVYLGYFLLTFLGFLLLFRRFPPGQDRQALAWYQGVASGCFLGGLLLFSLTDLWSDAGTRWFAQWSAMGCSATVQQLDALNRTTDLQGVLYGSFLPLMITGGVLAVLASQRSRRMRAAMRQTTP